MNRFLPAVVLALTACGSNATQTELPDGEPLVRGPVEEITHHATFSGILVSAGPGSVEPCGIQATADGTTRIMAVSPTGQVRPIEIGSLQVGDTVSVYVEGAVAESCPVQGTASVIVQLRPS